MKIPDKVVVRVRQADIALARQVGANCPIGYAAVRAFQREVAVGRRFIGLGRRSWMMPDRAVTFTEDYDHGRFRKLRPFRFTAKKVK